MDLTPKRSDESATEMVQVVLPNDANPLGFILGGTVMHLIDIAGAIACHRHTRSLLVTAAVDDLQLDRKSTRLNSSHTVISYAVFCLKKKKSRPATIARRAALPAPSA